MVLFFNIMFAKIQLILPPVTSNRVVLVLTRPGLTSLEVVLVQMNFISRDFFKDFIIELSNKYIFKKWTTLR